MRTRAREPRLVFVERCQQIANTLDRCHPVTRRMDCPWMMPVQRQRNQYDVLRLLGAGSIWGDRRTSAGRRGVRRSHCARLIECSACGVCVSALHGATWRFQLLRQQTRRVSIAEALLRAQSQLRGDLRGAILGQAAVFFWW